MELERREGWIWTGAVMTVLVAILLFGLSNFGIWDPWELNAADAARSLSEGAESAMRRPPLATWLVSVGFSTFGVREWAGRLPIALFGVLTLALAYLLGARFAGRRAGVYTALVTGTTPLFLFNSRQMLGDAPAFAAQALVALCALSAIYRPGGATEAARKRNAALWLGGLVLAVLFALPARGALLGAVAPLVAVTSVALLAGHLDPRHDRARAVAAWVVTGITVVLVTLVARAVELDEAEYSHLLGGFPRGGDPPSFDKGIEDVFHSFAPWSAIVLLGAGRMLWGGFAQAEAEGGAEAEGPSREARVAFRLTLVVWAAAGYGATTLFTSRYGPATYTAVVALGGLAAALLRDVEDSESPWWPAGIVGFLFAGLLVRDFDLYPSGPVDGLAIDGLTVPEVFNPKLAWSAVLGLFALTVLLGFGVGPGAKRPDLRAPYRWLRVQWRRGAIFKVWLCLGAILGGSMLLLGLVAWIAPDSLPVTTLVIRVGRKLLLVPVAVPVGVAATQIGLWGYSKLGRYRLLPLVLSGAVVGVYSGQFFLPALSAHFSPREVYDTYNELAQDAEPLGEWRVGGRAAAYYAQGDIQEIANQNELVRYLMEPGQRWAVFPADELPAVNRAYRRSTHQHLFVADASSARVVLVSSQPIEGRENENFLARVVLSEPPAIQNEVRARYENKIELLGYDIELPPAGRDAEPPFVGAGQDIAVTWYWRCLAPISGNYQIFVHVDGHGNRLNGDHEPVEGHYPVRLWDEGDIVVDRQELTVPANYRSGWYDLLVGFFAGNNRLDVEEGPEDNANRVRAGRILVR